jgi:NADPH:quinone reductase
VRDQVILVTGGAGAVGNYAIQWAKWGGAMVITTVSRPEQSEIAQRAGADHIINYKSENVPERIQAITGRDRGVNRIVDVDFYANLGLADAVLRTNGAIAYYACLPDQQAAIPLMSFMTRNITIHPILVYTMPQTAKEAAIRDIGVALESEALRHNIARRFPLTEVMAAHQAQESGTMIGKAVIEIL